MNHLNDLLDTAAGPASTRPVDAHADLTRGHRALARTRTRRGAVGLVGVAAVGALGVGLTRGGSSDTPVATDPSPVATVEPTPTPTPTPSPTTDPNAAADGFFAFGTSPPDGWTLQGADPATATFAREGDSTPMYDFKGKIVVMLSTGSDPAGQPQQVGGRTFWVAEHTGGGYARVSTRTRPQEPRAVLAVQYPASVGWSTDDVIAFLNDVRVLDGAQPVAD